jgi:hypothetical protein
VSEAQTVTERSFRREGALSALSAAAYWAATHPKVEIDTIVGDDDEVYLYYTESEETATRAPDVTYGRVYGPGDDFQLGGHVGYTLKGSRE